MGKNKIKSFLTHNYLKELEILKNFLVHCNEKTKIELDKTANELEDIKEALIAEKKVKEKI